MTSKQYQHIERCDKIIKLGGILSNDDKLEYHAIKIQKSNNHHQDFNSVILRLKQFFNVEQDQQLAKILDMNAQAFYERKQNLSIPYKHIITVLENYCSSDKSLLQHIFYGDEI